MSREEKSIQRLIPELVIIQLSSQVIYV
jgi:hypothetical protein